MAVLTSCDQGDIHRKRAPVVSRLDWIVPKPLTMYGYCDRALQDSNATATWYCVFFLGRSCTFSAGEGRDCSS
jgi:hypothetical protein